MTASTASAQSAATKVTATCARATPTIVPNKKLVDVRAEVAREREEQRARAERRDEHERRRYVARARSQRKRAEPERAEQRERDQPERRRDAGIHRARRTGESDLR